MTIYEVIIGESASLGERSLAYSGAFPVRSRSDRGKEAR